MSLVKRARVRETDVATMRRWRSVDNPEVALVEIKSKLGLTTRYVVVRRDRETGNELIVSRHRSKIAAKRAAERI